jgi:hypothetical protein
MSSEFRQYFTSDDLGMLERVLDHAGLYNIANDGDQQLRLSAAKFLIRRFQAGTIDEPGLYAALIDNLSRMELLTKSPVVVPMRLLAVGDLMMIGTRHGYRFGGQVSKNRSSPNDRFFGYGSGASSIGQMMVEGYADQVSKVHQAAPAAGG